MRIAYVLGTRPNFVKMAPVISVLRDRLPGLTHEIIHTGQHYDRMMSEIFFEQLDVPAPDHLLQIGSGSHAEQTARVMERLEPILTETRPDLVLVPGDVNSTMAATVTAAKLQIPVGHIESGLRSFDRTMPEELNRIVTDALARDLYVHSEEAVENLTREGADPDRIAFVGNTMIDSLVAVEQRFRKLKSCREHGVEAGSYLLLTLHRPALVDGPLLDEAVAALNRVAMEMPALFPVHPRTRARMEAGKVRPSPNLRLIDPVGYLEFLSLQADAGAVLTDSGGVQEETTYLGVPCFTLRDNTERPVTVRAGTNTMLGLDPSKIVEIPELLSSRKSTPKPPPPLWDGKAAERVGDRVEDLLFG